MTSTFNDKAKAYLSQQTVTISKLDAVLLVAAAQAGLETQEFSCNEDRKELETAYRNTLKALMPNLHSLIS